MTIVELKDHAARMLDFGIEQIRTNGDLRQMFHLVCRDGTIEVMLIDGRITNSEDAKRALGRQLKARVATGEIEAVIQLSDTYWTSDMDPEKDKIRQALDMTIEQAGKAGFCTVHEGILCVLQSPILYQTTIQEYKRDGERCELAGEPRTGSDEDGAIERPAGGRFDFFPRQGGAGGAS